MTDWNLTISPSEAVGQASTTVEAYVRAGIAFAKDHFPDFDPVQQAEFAIRWAQIAAIDFDTLCSFKARERAAMIAAGDL
jgi:hypothetical protein